MPIADSKKVATMLNIISEQAAVARAAVEKMKTTRARFEVVNPDVTGTPLQGKKGAVSTAINNLDAELGKPVWDEIIAARVPSHRGKALDDER